MSKFTIPRHAIGIIQGRLVPQIGERIQAFPVEQWEDEFEIAAELGFDSIELTIEMASWSVHPLRSEEGRARLAELSRTHGVALAGLCCDTIMEKPLSAADPDERLEAEEMLRSLIADGAAGDLPMLELPVMGKASLRDLDKRQHFVEAMNRLLPLAEDAGIDILIESDLPPVELAALAETINHPRFGINYDTGNSTWFGFDPDDELPRLLPFIRNVHIKDCTKADYSVPLGTGETSFKRVIHWLKKSGYSGGFVLQAARQSDNVAAAGDYLEFTHQLIASLIEKDS